MASPSFYVTFYITNGIYNSNIYMLLFSWIYHKSFATRPYSLYLLVLTLFLFQLLWAQCLGISRHVRSFSVFLFFDSNNNARVYYLSLSFKDYSFSLLTTLLRTLLELWRCVKYYLLQWLLCAFRPASGSLVLMT